MSLSAKILDGPVFNKSDPGPADRLSGIGMLITLIGIALTMTSLATTIVLSLADNQALANKFAVLAICSFIFSFIGSVFGLLVSTLIYKNVDPNATPDPLVAEFVAEPTARLR